MSDIVIGTRASPLAMWQAKYMRDAILASSSILDIELKVIKTSGDHLMLAESFSGLDKGLFTKEIENELLAHRIDLAVHSLKDLPTQMAEGLVLAAIAVREDPADAIISKSGAGLGALPAGAKVLTGSLRRRGQLLHRRRDLQVLAVRGNVQTRLRKLGESEAEAMILARAGLIRCGLDERISERLDPVDFLPACGQGAIAVQTRLNDERMREIVGALDHTPTRLAVAGERAFLASLGGGCQVPVGAYARFGSDGAELTLTGMVSSLGGDKLLKETVAATVHNETSAEALGQELGLILRNQGCQEIIAEVIRVSQSSSEERS